MDEKSQIQALDRTQPSLPMKKGRAATMTHDYKRNGTTTLFAALNVLTGVVIGQCWPRHRNDEFVKFLRRIDRETPKGLQVHLILDNYATHKHPNVEAWLAKHPRFHFHFTPTSSSWLNLRARLPHHLDHKYTPTPHRLASLCASVAPALKPTKKLETIMQQSRDLAVKHYDANENNRPTNKYLVSPNR